MDIPWSTVLPILLVFYIIFLMPENNGRKKPEHQGIPETRPQEPSGTVALSKDDVYSKSIKSKHNEGNDMAKLEDTEFYGEELVKALKEAGFKTAFVEQSGGGTATIYARKTEEDAPIEERDEYVLGGPGSFDWENSGASVFTTDEFAIGEEQYYADGEHEKDWDPEAEWTESGTSIDEMVAIFEKMYVQANEKVKAHPAPKA